jgi:cell surface protein SprA
MYDEDKPANKISIMGNPSLGEIKTMMIGVRNLSNNLKSGDVWVNELRLKEYNNKGGWAADGALNVQLSDLGSVNVQGRYVSDGFGGIEDGVSQRSMDNTKSYNVTANVDLGKFFPDKAKVSAPLYYSISKEETRPRYNPLDTDMLLSDALDAAANKHERDSIESIAVTKTTNTNFSLSNVRWGLQTKRHPMPYDPANLSFSYSHSHNYSSGETTVYEKEDNWRCALDYNWTPVYKTFEPFAKAKSKWLDFFKRFGLNYLPQNIAASSEITRNYYELQERDIEDLGSESSLPLTFSEQFLWNRNLSMRWDLTKNLHINFQSATNAQIDEPYTPVNKDLYPDAYQAWKDSVRTSIRHFGTPLDYNQNLTMSYQLPLNLIPVFDWVNSDMTYSATYNWTRGSELEDSTNLGNTISNNRNFSVNGSFNLERLYNHIPFLKKANDRARKQANEARNKNRRNTSNAANRQRINGDKNNAVNKKRGDEKTMTDKNKPEGTKQLPKNKNSFEKEIVLKPDTSFLISHNKKTKRIIVSAHTADGKTFDIKYRKSGLNAIKILSRVDTATKIKLTVTAREPLDDKPWYKTAQTIARVLMMVRTVNVSYRNQYSMSLPGFMPTVGDAFGQKRSTSALAPGLGFAFGLTGDSYINTARDRGWLLMNDSVASPASTNKTEDLQVRMTLEPINNLKIDLNAARTETTAKSIQYMYDGSPTTQSGTFTMTTISIKSAFEGIGNATSGYHSASFDKFCNSLESFRSRVEAQYANAVYPEGTAYAGQKFDAVHGGVDVYSADVMVPAFLSAYTSIGGNGLDIFPSLSRMLPNWTMRYSGLINIPWFGNKFKSFNVNHAYKSIYAVGSYSSFSTFQEYMNGLGFITDATTSNPVPSSMFNVSTVSINESFSPLLGIDMTFQNDLTAKVEYRSTRVLSLSMTSVQINEAVSHDWVLGFGYRINDFNPFTHKVRRVRSSAKSVNGSAKSTNNQSATTTNKRSGSGFNNSLNLRLDLSYRKQASISRDIASMTSAASSGNTAFKLSFIADYSLSKMLSLSFYFDTQTNTPLLSSSSYPTTTHDFGLNLKFSLTR